MAQPKIGETISNDQFNNLGDIKIGQTIPNDQFTKLTGGPNATPHTGFWSGVGSAAKNQLADYKTIADTASSAINTAASIATQGTKQVVGGIVGTVGGAIGGTVGALGQTGIETARAIQGKGFDVGKIGEQTVNTAKETAKFGYDIGKTGTEQAAIITFGGKIPMLIQGGALGIDAAQSLVDGHYMTAAGELTAAGATILGAKFTKGQLVNKEAVTALKGVIGETASKVAPKTMANFAPKTLDKVLATPLKDVHKMTASQRSAWFSNQKSVIESKAAETQALAKKQSIADKVSFNNQKSIINSKAAQTEALAKKQSIAAKIKGEEDLSSLNNQLQTASRDKTLELRPKIINAMGKQSNQYRQIVDSELQGKTNIKVRNTDISSYIDNRYPDDPFKSAQIKEILGLTEKVDPLSIKPSGLKLQTTVGEMWNNTKDLKQSIRKSAKNSTSVFTPKEKITDDAIKTMTDFLKDSHGVDLSKANQFWSKYAPIRDEMISKAKPFLNSGTKTSGMDNALIKSSKGINISGENFIKEVNNLLGEDVTKEVKEIVSKMNAVKKNIATKQLEADLIKEDARLMKERGLRLAKDKLYSDQLKTTSIKENASLTKGQRLKSMSDAEFEVERLASKRDTIKKWLGRLGYVAAGATIGAPAVNKVKSLLP